MIVIALLITLLILIGYYFFIKNNYQLVMLLIFKFFVLYFALNLNETIIIVFLFFAVCLFYVLIFISKNIKVKNYKEYILFLLILIFVFIFSGCNKRQVEMPVVEKIIKLNFMPSDVSGLNNNEILVGAERENKIAVVDINTGSIKKNINSGMNAVDILIKDNFIYSANKTSSNITIHNLLKDETVNMQSGGQYPSAIALNNEKKLLYVANTGSSNISIIDIQNKQIKGKIPTEKWPSDILITKDNKYLYVPCKYTNVIQLIDVEKEKCLFTKIEAGISPTQLIELNKRYIAIINEWEYSFNQQSTVNIFDIKEYDLKYNIRVDGGIFRAALSKSKKYLYITVPLKDKIIFIDISKKEKVFEINQKDKGPKFISVSSNGEYIFVSCQTSKEIVIIKVNDLL